MAVLSTNKTLDDGLWNPQFMDTGARCCVKKKKKIKQLYPVLSDVCGGLQYT